MNKSALNGKLNSKMRRWAPVACCLLPLAFSAVACSDAPAKVAGAEVQKPSEALDNALELLKNEKPALKTYQTAAEQLNSYLDLDPAATARLTLSDAEKKLIMTPGLFDVRFDGLKEVERRSFSSVDGHYLDSCFLFRDAAKWLQNLLLLEADVKSEQRQLQLAQMAFGWVDRQVALQGRVRDPDDWRAKEFMHLVRQQHLTKDQAVELFSRGLLDPNEPWRDGPWPAHETLRRGTGDAEERLRVFLALLDQLGLDGCVIPRRIVVKDSDGTQVERERPWAAGVLIGKDVFLFDPLLGKPVPAPDGQGIATLRELRKDAAAVVKPLHAEVAANEAFRQRLSQCLVDPGDPVAVTAAQLEKPAVLLAVNLSAVSPRMRELHGWLREKGNNPITLFDDLQARLKRFQAADLGVDVRLWTGFPYVATLLARFEGNDVNLLRKQATYAPRFALAPEWARKLADDLGPPEKSDRLFDMLDVAFHRVLSEPGSAHDLLVRGRPEQAIDRILYLDGYFDKIGELLPQQPDLTKAMVDPIEIPSMPKQEPWRVQLLNAEAYLNELANEKNRLKKEEAAAARDLDDKIRRTTLAIDGMWLGRKIQLNYLNHQWSMPLVREHLTYFMGVAKMELAMRAELQARRQTKATTSPDQLTPLQQWQSAAEWFERYLVLVLPRPRNLWGQASVTQLAVCKAAIARLGPKPAAETPKK
jgi:hypothetical protein